MELSVYEFLKQRIHMYLAFLLLEFGLPAFRFGGARLWAGGETWNTQLTLSSKCLIRLVPPEPQSEAGHWPCQGGASRVPTLVFALRGPQGADF